jgi:hypothetical protein
MICPMFCTDVWYSCASWAWVSQTVPSTARTWTWVRPSSLR